MQGWVLAPTRPGIPAWLSRPELAGRTAAPVREQTRPSRPELPNRIAARPWASPRLRGADPPRRDIPHTDRVRVAGLLHHHYRPGRPCHHHDGLVVNDHPPIHRAIDPDIPEADGEIIRHRRAGATKHQHDPPKSSAHHGTNLRTILTGRIQGHAPCVYLISCRAGWCALCGTSLQTGHHPGCKTIQAASTSKDYLKNLGVPPQR